MHDTGERTIVGSAKLLGKIILSTLKGYIATDEIKYSFKVVQMQPDCFYAKLMVSKEGFALESFLKETPVGVKMYLDVSDCDILDPLVQKLLYKVVVGRLGDTRILLNEQEVKKQHALVRQN